MSGGPYTTIATTTNATRYEDTTAAGGTVYYYVVSALNSSGESSNSTEVVASPTPFPWSNSDVGAVGLAGGGAVSDNGVFTISGAGTLLNYTNASYNFTWEPMTGDGTIVARFVQHTRDNSLGGVMMSETLDVGSKAASVVYYGGMWKRAEMCTRATTGASGTWIGSTVSNAPVWLMLVRSGNVFTGYGSADGTNWTTITSATIAMAANIYVGLVVESTSTNALDTVTFDNVSAPCIAPTGLYETAAPGQVTFGWTACLGAASYNIKRATNSGGPYAAIGTMAAPNLTYTDTTVISGAQYYYVVSAVNAMGASANSAPYKAWLNVDIGVVGLSGSCKFTTNGVFTGSGAGTLLNYTNASYNLTYRPMTGDGTMIARFTQHTRDNSLAGVMMSETLDVGSKAASVVYYGGMWKRAMMCNRTTTGASGTWTSNTTVTNPPPTWLKLVRSGNLFAGYGSADGDNWTTITSATIAMAPNIYVGLVVESTSTNAWDTATLDTVTPP